MKPPVSAPLRLSARLGRRAVRWALALGTGPVLPGAAGALVVSVTTVVWAGPRDDLREAYEEAKGQFNDLDLDAALATLDAAIERAQKDGLTGDPALAPLHVLRGGILFSNNGAKAQVLDALRAGTEADYHITLPIELRSAELQKLLGEARRAGKPPAGEAIIHTPPALTSGEDVEFTVQANLALPDGAQLVLYWRRLGDSSEFAGITMERFGSLGTAKIPAADIGDGGVEYFIYLFDRAQSPLANRGDKDHPMVLRPVAGTGPVAAGPKADGGPSTPDEPEPEPRSSSKGGPWSTGTLPRVFINLGIGTGVGIARGTAELTYQQFTPAPGSATYQIQEQACAVERWFAGGQPLAGSQADFANHAATVAQIPGALPAAQADLVSAYDPDYCARRHPVSTGLASAPLHLAPEVGFRVSRNVVLSLFSRLEVVTGSRVYTEDPTRQPTDSFTLDVRSGNPKGYRRKPPFTWALGMKVKYFFLPETRKFRLFVGGFAGYGQARLRVNMGFSNDRNGNSVPDAVESGLSGPLDEQGFVIRATCVPVWPYVNGCVPEESSAGGADRALAVSVANNTKASDTRIDTVRIGPGFVGGLFGFHYQVVKYFGIYGELAVGGWFPNTSSLLTDITVGPVITF